MEIEKHAVETLHSVVVARPSLPVACRKSWLKHAKKALHAGEIAKLMELFDRARSSQPKVSKKDATFSILPTPSVLTPSVPSVDRQGLCLWLHTNVILGSPCAMKEVIR
jgi:hypothetical protein